MDDHASHAFVMAGKDVPSPLLKTKHHQNKTQEELRELSKAHRRSLALPLIEYAQNKNMQVEMKRCPRALRSV